MTLRAFGRKWGGLVASGAASRAAGASSAASAANAMAPKPAAHCLSISRRERGASMKRRQCTASDPGRARLRNENELFVVDRDVAQVGPHARVVGAGAIERGL